MAVKSSKTIWWMTVSQNTETLPVLLINYLQSRKQDLYKVSTVFSTHFPKDRNCDICLRTKMTRASCRRRTGGAPPPAGAVVPRTEGVGDLITADHKILSEESESRNDHRYAVVVQDLATQWIHSYPCTTKTFTLTIPGNLEKPVKIFPGIIARQHHTDRRLMVLQKEQCAE